MFDALSGSNYEPGIRNALVACLKQVIDEMIEGGDL